MSKVRINGTRMTAAVWASLGMVGIAVAFHSILSLAAAKGVLPWPMAAGGIGAVMIRFMAGVSLACMALWGIYKQTVHGRDDLHS